MNALARLDLDVRVDFTFKIQSEYPAGPAGDFVQRIAANVSVIERTLALIAEIRTALDAAIGGDRASALGISAALAAPHALAVAISKGTLA